MVSYDGFTALMIGFNLFVSLRWRFNGHLGKSKTRSHKFKDFWLQLQILALQKSVSPQLKWRKVCFIYCLQWEKSLGKVLKRRRFVPTRNILLDASFFFVAPMKQSPTGDHVARRQSVSLSVTLYFCLRQMYSFNTRMNWWRHEITTLSSVFNMLIYSLVKGLNAY